MSTLETRCNVAACRVGSSSLQILFFGLTLSSSWGNGHATPYRALLKALSQRGIRVYFFERDVPYYAKHRDFTSCDFCQLVFYPEWQAVRETAMRRARDSDIVVTASYLSEGTRISEDLLGIHGPLHVFYDLDTPLTLNRLLRGRTEYLEAWQIPQFDLCLSFTGGRILHRLQDDFGARLARPLYGCVDPDVYRRVQPSAEFTCWLSYMGTYALDRRAKLEDLFLTPARHLLDRRFLLAGSLYPPELQWPANVKCLEHVPPGQHPQLYSSSRATLNLTRAEMAESGYCPSGRFFEAGACGAPLLTDEWDGLETFFNPNEELFLVGSPNDVERVLSLPEEELNRTAARARERTLAEHTGAQRAQQFLRYCEEARTLTGPEMETVS